MSPSNLVIFASILASGIVSCSRLYPLPLGGKVGEVLIIQTEDSIKHLGNDNSLVTLLPLALSGYRAPSQRHGM
jgi:hypothetical protein